MSALRLAREHRFYGQSGPQREAILTDLPNAPTGRAFKGVATGRKKPPLAQFKRLTKQHKAIIELMIYGLDQDEGGHVAGARLTLIEAADCIGVRPAGRRGGGDPTSGFAPYPPFWTSLKSDRPGQHMQPI
jgi:hypothetical protein